MKAFRFARPTNLREALAQKGTWMGGGIDILSRMKRGTYHPSLLVEVGPLADLRSMTREKGRGLLLGAGLRLAQILNPGNKIPAGILQAVKGTATPQIRNSATLVGNLLQEKRCLYLLDPEISCFGNGGEGCPAKKGHHKGLALFEPGPCLATQSSNLAPIFCALDAELRLTKNPKETRGLSLRDFYGAWRKKGKHPNPGLVQAIAIPEKALRGGSAHHEIRVKKSFDWAIATAAAHLFLEGNKIQGVSLWLGSVSDIPYQAKVVERALLEKSAPDFKKAATLLAGEASLQSPQQEWKRKMAILCAEKALQKAYDNAKENR